MARAAQGLPIALVPEETGVSTMRLDVVDELGLDLYPAFLLAVATPRIESEKRLALALPLLAVAA